MNKIPESDLILNNDGSVYHLNLLPGDLAETIIIVGDPGRVPVVSGKFDVVELRKHKREFVTHTGSFNGKRISVISTGIGTDNIDIVFNEIDALFNIDFENRSVKNNLTKLDFVRLGTSGALQEDVYVDSFILATFGLGLDGLLNYYKLSNDQEEYDIIDAFRMHFHNRGIFPRAYISKCSSELQKKLDYGVSHGITASCQGFYAPQGRILRFDPEVPDLIESISSFNYNGLRVTNFEMESGAAYGMARVLGHNCIAINAIIANRIKKQFSRDPHAAIDKLIQNVLERLTS
jgi:uridine phosphorylase